MDYSHSALSPYEYLGNIFASKAVKQGGVIRRKARDIERFRGRDRLKSGLQRRGFRAVENAGQIEIFCNREPLKAF